MLYNDWRFFQSLNPDQKHLYDLLGAYDYRFPQGENIPDVRARIQSWTDTLIREFAGKHVMLITHHLTILALRAQFERLSPDEFLELDKKCPPVNCGVTIYRSDDSAGKSGKLLLDKYNKKLY